MSEYIVELDSKHSVALKLAFAEEMRGGDFVHEEVVRCRDCRYAIDLCDGTIDCTGPLTTGWDYYNDEPQQNIVEPNGFCAWGERRDEQ